MPFARHRGLAMNAAPPPAAPSGPSAPGDGPPPAGVLAAYGVAAAEPVWMGGAWRAGPLVLKRTAFLPETLWRAEVLAALPGSPAFRVPRPIPSYGVRVSRSRTSTDVRGQGWY
ncbi:hypothetical protein [Nonomuraea sp. GTA35]|uniref:hypothetical protein n=1 Tax=Nonomuraea sp. GTA35 TaxID=1676746 RepID=UPI0035BF5944